MRPTEARYEDAFLKPATPLPLRAGENVGVIVVLRPNPSRWNLKRLAQSAPGEESLAEVGLDEWVDSLLDEDGH